MHGESPSAAAPAPDAWTPAQRAELLARHRPCLRYDALEVYFADAAEEWTRNPANRLRRRHGPDVSPAGGLSLDFLGTTYGDGHPADPDDVIESSRDDYDEQYFQLRRGDPALRNVIYGRAVDGTSGLWLQYWFFYFLNDYELAWGIDVHEGDWETVQLRVPRGEGAPDIAAYAQHAFAEVRAWEDVGRLAGERRREGTPVEPGDDDRPLVYVGRGSHASFFEPGYHETDFYDLTDGLQRAKTPTRLVDVTVTPPWLAWPGSWGGRRTGYPGPTAPCRHRHWDRPEQLLDAEGVHTRPRADPPGAPRLAALARDGRLRIDFDASRCPDALATIVATVNCSDDHADPPRAIRLAVADLERGTLQTRYHLDPRKHYDVRVAAVDDRGRPTPGAIFLFAPPDPLRALLRRLTSALGRLVFALRRALGIEEGRRSHAPLA